MHMCHCVREARTGIVLCEHRQLKKWKLQAGQYLAINYKKNDWPNSLVNLDSKQCWYEQILEHN